MIKPFKSLTTALAWAACASVSYAQSLALVDLVGTPESKDPHPTTYIWEGATDPVKEPVQYYTFYYTGTVGNDARVPVDTDIQRIAISNAEWEANKAAIIARLATFYEQAYPSNAPQQPKKGKVVFDENFNYVETNKPDQGPKGSVDPRAAAEWLFYYDQFVLWQFYCRRNLLNDKEARDASGDRNELQRDLDRAALEGFEDINVEDVLNAAEEIRQAESGAAPDAKAAEKKKPAAKPSKAGASTTKQPNKEIVVEVATVFDPEADYADPHHNDVFHDEFVRLADKREKESTQIFTKMIARIDERAQEMQRYDEWLKDRSNQLREFTRAWGKVKQGNNVFFDDVFYILVNSDTEIESREYGTMVIPVRQATTPQDLIGRDGKLKKPADD